MADADSTHIQQPDQLVDALAKMKAHADSLKAHLDTLVPDIRARGAKKPWGHAAEFGGKFEAIYTHGSGGPGADAILDNVGKLADKASTGAQLAYEAVSASTDVDSDAAKNFLTGAFVNGTDGQPIDPKGSMSQAGQAQTQFDHGTGKDGPAAGLVDPNTDLHPKS